MKRKINFWDKIAFAYDFAQSLNKSVYSTMLNDIINLTSENGKVLECASGTGEISMSVAPFSKSVLCTDTSMKMLEKVKIKANKKDIHNIQFSECDIMNINCKSEYYDTVIAGNVLHLIDEPEKAVRELWRVTAKGGKLILPTYILGESKISNLIKIYKIFGFNTKNNYTKDSYVQMLKNSAIGDFKMKVIRGKIPMALAVFEK